MDTPSVNTTPGFKENAKGDNKFVVDNSWAKTQARKGK